MPNGYDARYFALTTSQVADLLNASPATIRGWISRGLFPPKDGELTSVKTPYWYLTTIAEYLRNAPGGRLGYPVE